MWASREKAIATNHMDGMLPGDVALQLQRLQVMRCDWYGSSDTQLQPLDLVTKALCACMQTVISGLEEQLKPALAKQQQDLDQVAILMKSLLHLDHACCHSDVMSVWVVTAWPGVATTAG